MPDTKININQVNPINKVCPKSGCKTNSKTITDVIKKEKFLNLQKPPKNIFLIPYD